MPRNNASNDAALVLVQAVRVVAPHREEDMLVVVRGRNELSIYSRARGSNYQFLARMSARYFGSKARCCGVTASYRE